MDYNVDYNELNEYADVSSDVLEAIAETYEMQFNGEEQEPDVIEAVWVMDGVDVHYKYDRNRNRAPTRSELQQYINRGRERFCAEGGVVLTKLDLVFDGDYVDIHYYTNPVPFQRIRRITGYLVGTLDRFNDGKAAEEADRVKHRCC